MENNKVIKEQGRNIGLVMKHVFFMGIAPPFFGL